MGKDLLNSYVVFKNEAMADELNKNHEGECQRKQGIAYQIYFH